MATTISIDEDLLFRMKALHVIPSRVMPLFEKALADRLEREAARQGRLDLLRKTSRGRMQNRTRQDNRGMPRIASD